MRKILLILALFISAIGFSQENRNILTTTYNRAQVFNACENNLDWVKYPSYTDRAAWEKIPQAKRDATIAAGEKYLGFDWPNVLPSMYLEFTRTGNRAIVDNMISQRLTALRSLFYAELVEGKGRFIDDIINGVFAYCEQTYWGSSAHFYLYEYGSPTSNPTTILPDASNPVIDLTVGDVSSTLSWIWYFLHDEFDKVSPIINDRLIREMYEKVLNPFYSKNDFWWITGWNSGNVNNWTPWCCYNMLTCVLIFERDPQKRLDGIYKTMRSVDLFINSYPDDGGCSEGPSYWGAAVGKLHNYLTLLKSCSNGKIDIFDQDIIKEMGRYIYKLYIANGNNYVNFADAPAKLGHDGLMIARYGKDISDPRLEGFGEFLAENAKTTTQPISGDVGQTLFNTFGHTSSVRPLEVLVSETYLPDLQIAVGRDLQDSNEGFFFAAKGGNNGEQHNHNDVGSFILFYNGVPVFVDPGVGTYTKQTFSPDRYKIWTMQSGYHNLPVINGTMQASGGKYKAVNSTFKTTSSLVEFSVDIAGAYPETANVSSWVRKYSLKRRKSFIINDSYALNSSKDKTFTVFMTPLKCEDANGAVTISGDGFKLRLSYPSSMIKCTIEEKIMDDPKLANVWGEKLNRIVFEIKSDKNKNDISYELTKVGG
ncbi:MAG: heparinase II/III family protein [Bacteroidales bacterium]|nr:heparinase II/III family protein [Bacteroidales bacterium]